MYKFVQKQKDTRGNDIYYFRRSKKDRRFRLPDDPHSKQFREIYLRLFRGEEVTLPPTIRERKADAFIQRANYEAMRALRLAKKRASERGREFDIDEQWVSDELERNGYLCQLTGIAFDVSIVEGGARPFGPSIDRLDNSRGYTKDNCRIILTSMNIMLNTWGDEIFEKVAKSFIRERNLRTRRERACPSQ